MKKMHILTGILKGVGAALVITLVSVAVMALFIKGTLLQGTFISMLTLVVKLASVISGGIVAILSIRRKGALTGLSVALIYWVVCFVLAGIIDGFEFDFKTVLDMILTSIAGSATGILAVNALK